MSLIKCPQCKVISGRALMCPNCGYQMREDIGVEGKASYKDGCLISQIKRQITQMTSTKEGNSENKCNW